MSSTGYYRITATVHQNEEGEDTIDEVEQMEIDDVGVDGVGVVQSPQHVPLPVKPLKTI